MTFERGGTFDGAPYGSIVQNGNQANVRQEGLEVTFLRQPRVGLGFPSAVDLLRDYAYGRNPNVAVNSIFDAGTPADDVQLPSYPYSKMRNDLFYQAGGARASFAATTYGANNALGEPGFTEFDADLRLPLLNGLHLNIGGTNIFNQDDYQAAGIYNGGPVFTTVGGIPGYTTLFFV